MKRIHSKRGGKVLTRRQRARNESEVNAAIERINHPSRMRDDPNLREALRVDRDIEAQIPDYVPRRRAANRAAADDGDDSSSSSDSDSDGGLAAAPGSPQHDATLEGRFAEHFRIPSSHPKDMSQEANIFHIPAEAPKRDSAGNTVTRIVQGVLTNVMVSSNFFIFPTEIVRFFVRHDDFFEEEGAYLLMDLRKVFNLFEEWDREWEEIGSDRAFIQSFFHGNERMSLSLSESFFRNEYFKIFCGPNSSVYPSDTLGHRIPLIGEIIPPSMYSPPRLRIPYHEVMDFPTHLMIYILFALTHHRSGQRFDAMIRYNYQIMYSFTANPNSDQQGRIQDESNKNIIQRGGKIRVEDLYYIYITIFTEYTRLVGVEFTSDVRWNGSEDSGTRIRLYNNPHFNTSLYITLYFYPVPSVSLGHKWTPEIEKVMEKSVGTSIISVKNEHDNKCLIYCIVMGLIRLRPGGSRAFGLRNLMIPDYEIFTKGQFFFSSSDDDDIIVSEIKRFTSYLLPPSSVGDRVDFKHRFVEDIDKKTGIFISVSEFRKEFEKIEEILIPDKTFGIDVFGLDMNISKHIYPLYSSQRNRETVIELLCVTPPETKCSHFGLIINKEKLLKNSGGKQFFSCSKCGKSFFHRRLLNEHHCLATVSSLQINDEDGYHFSKKNDDKTKQVVGICSKCRLCFSEPFEYEYHKNHCLMQGQIGYRHVQLKTYDKDESPKLHGEELNLEAENKHVVSRRVMYADFECCIHPETGEHEFMSYGIYDWNSGIYKCGYSLDEFMNFIIDLAFSSDQDQIYVYFHNAMGYDANFVLRFVLSNPHYSDWGINVIMKSMNRLQKLVFHVHHDGVARTIHIGDTFLFLTLSLERIVDCIRKEDIAANLEKFPRFFEIFHKRYPGIENEEINHILRKNIFPYKFFSSPDKLETSKDEFLKIFEPREENLQYFSEKVTVPDLEKSYEDTKHVMDIFICRNARDYHDIYLCCDVMQLADIFDRTMKILWDSHHIHLTRYLGMPSASWAAFLRHDPTMEIPLYENTFFAEFFKAMIRGGITSAALRHAVADEKHSIIYLDVNGLYPYVMQAYDYPCGNFSFVPLRNQYHIKLFFYNHQ